MTQFTEELTTQYQAFTAGNGFVTLPWGIVQITGLDRQAFLHNFCTADIKKMQSGEGTEAFLLNVKGKILGYVYLIVGEESILLLNSGGSVEAIINHLDRYIIREDVQLSDVSNQLHCYLAQIQMTEFGLQSVEAYLNHISFNEDDSHCVAVKTNLTSKFETLLISAFSEDKAVEWFSDRGMIQVEPKVFEICRIENGTPIYGKDITDSNLPQEIRRDQEAISFNKGCYLGQETVARIDALGHVNKFLVKLKFDGKTVPPTNTELTDGEKKVGEVTSACHSPEKDIVVGLGYIKRGLESSGQSFQSDSEIVTIY